MPSRRDQIRMSERELADFLSEQKIVSVATIGPGGRPHLVPLWYVPGAASELRGWTYGASQKARNLERDPYATVQVEDGIEYHELRGVMMECQVQVEREPERVAEYGVALFERYGAGSPLADDVHAMVVRQAAKRVGLRFTPTKIVSWDHSKLDGAY